MLAETLAAFTQPRDTHDKATPASAVDALAAIANAGCNQSAAAGSVRGVDSGGFENRRRAPTRV